MEYKTEFGPRKLTFGQLNPGQLFRLDINKYPCIRGGGSRNYACIGSGNSGEAQYEDRVVRIRIARVEDGIPVFVDA